MFRSILVAVDPSPTRHSAVRTAGEMARLTGAEVHVVHIAVTAIAWDTAVRVEEEPEAREILEEALAALREAGVKADGELMHAATEQVPGAIAQAARQYRADLLVLGPHHRGTLAAFFNPRVSDAVAHASRVAVLFAPEALETNEG
ncbi:universal stress protein [Streptomyces flaveolus]|uniref:universal stress protein n=1 Tax=Streptomyces flaveolus TaxID=67297 RepID=UPI0036F6EA40